MLTALLISSAYAIFTPGARAAEPTIQEKGVSILSNVAGLDLAKYNVTTEEYQQDSYFDVVPEDNVGYTLESDNSKLDVYCTFANGKLHILHVLENEGSPSMTKTCNGASEMAKNFLSDYAAYSGNTLYDELSLMLNGIDAGENSTVARGNVELQVNASAECTRFSWRYTFNGVAAGDKCVALGFKNGFLKYFVDTWDLYKVGSTAINLSKEEAVDIAIETAKAFSYNVGSGNDTFEVKDFNVTTAKVTQLVFCSSIGADKTRCDDPLMLFPMWRIGVGLDRFYPGNVYGIYVDIWADTLQVRHVQEAFTTLTSELVGPRLFDDASGTLGSHVSTEDAQLDSTSLLWIAIPAATVISIGAVPIWLRLKKRSSRFHDFPRLRLSRFTAGLLCLLMFSVVVLAPVSLAKADTWRATIWGCEVWKTSTEIEQQQATASNVAADFSFSGYNTNNYQGDYTVKSNILTQIEDSEENYDKAAVVYFDHGVGDENPDDYDNWHYQVVDNNGASVFDSDIFPLTYSGKTYFAFINTCLSANISWQGNYYGTGAMVGMPYAFTHRIVGDTLSSNGYDYPDGGAFCYIGFPWGSASLTQIVDDDHQSSYYYMWVEKFFYYALHNYWSINMALDQASLYYFSEDFGDTALHNEFTADWGKTFSGCKMVVYGNGNRHLCSAIKVVAWGWNGQFYTQTATDVYIDGQYAGNTNYMYITKTVVPGNHTVEVSSSAPGGPFQLFEGYDWCENPITVYVAPETQTQVECGYFYNFSLSISAGTGGSTNPSGTQYYAPEDTAYVTATPDEDHIFDHWLKDGNPAGTNPTIGVYMGDDYTLQAVFRDPLVTVLARDQNGIPVYNTVNVYVDGDPAGTAGSSFSVTAGQHTLQVSVPGSGAFHNFTYPSGSSASNPMTFTVSGDMTVTAYFTLPYYWVGVDAYCQYCYVPAGVSFDGGQWTGTAGDYFHVPEGNHQIAVEGYVYDTGWGPGWGQAGFWCFDGYDLGVNPISVSVASNTDIYALYWYY
jgi:hypothetical protein